MVRDAGDFAAAFGQSHRLGPCPLVDMGEEFGHDSPDLRRAVYSEIGIRRRAGIIAQDVQCHLWQIHHNPSCPLGRCSSVAGKHQKP
jgi:hypothetical protein